ncbi:MAG: hypothetical protein ACR2HV_03350 [Acidimicrobiales bacterium]
MTRSGARTPGLAIAAALLLIGAACGGGGGSKTPTVAEDRATAERIVLTKADLPGFTEDATDDTSSGLDKCFGRSQLPGAKDNPRGVNGTDYTKDRGTLRVQSSAGIAEKEVEATQMFSDFEAALSSQCLKDALKANVEASTPGLRAGEVTSAPLPDPGVTDDSVATRLTIPISVDGERLSLVVDIMFLRQGRALATFSTLGQDTPFPEAERTRLVALVGERMRGENLNFPDTTSGRSASTTVPAPPTTAAGGPAGSTTLRHSSGVTLDHPPTWTVEPSSSSGPLVVLFIDPTTGVPFRRNVNIQRSGPDPVTLDELTQRHLKQISEIPGSSTGEVGPTTLSGFPAYRVDYRGTVDSEEFRSLAVWTVRGDTAWVVTYTSDPARYDAALPDVERVLTSIQLPA